MIIIFPLRQPKSENTIYDPIPIPVEKASRGDTHIL